MKAMRRARIKYKHVKERWDDKETHNEKVRKIKSKRKRNKNERRGRRKG